MKHDFKTQPPTPETAYYLDDGIYFARVEGKQTFPEKLHCIPSKHLYCRYVLSVPGGSVLTGLRPIKGRKNVYKGDRLDSNGGKSYMVAYFGRDKDSNKAAIKVKMYPNWIPKVNAK